MSRSKSPGTVTENDQAKPVLTASVNDVRPLSALLRGINFANRSTVMVHDNGLTINVEEARTLTGTAFVFREIFDEFTYTPEPAPAPSSPVSDTSQDHDPIPKNTAFEIPLNTLIECLNIFGTAGASSISNPTTKLKKWRKTDGGSENEADGSDTGRGNHRPNGTNRIDHYFSGSEKRTGMRMSYVGVGHPLTLIIAEDATGPTTTCEITTYDPEPHLELPFDPDLKVLTIILKSSWLRDALSELDPSCDKLTFIGNPPSSTDLRSTAVKPMLRIQAVGTFGSTEMDYPNDRDVLETFECSQTVRFTYRFAHISKALRALQSSTKTSLRIDREGLLSLQFLMSSPKPRGGTCETFIEFRCLALDEDL